MAGERNGFSREGISRFRQELMGVAILLVLIRHGGAGPTHFYK